MPLIIDAAASLGGRDEDGGWVGGSGDAEVFSMHATKVFGVGEGGAVFVRKPLAGLVRRTINFGLADGVPETLGFNGKLSEVHAAIGLAVLERMDGFVRVAQRSPIGIASDCLRSPALSTPQTPGCRLGRRIRLRSQAMPILWFVGSSRPA